MSTTGRFDVHQHASAVAANAEFFADNEQYKSAQKRLELYRFIALTAAHETEQTRALLDIAGWAEVDIFAHDG